MLTLVKQHVLAVLKDRKGVTALEYGVLAAGIVAVVAIAAVALGSNLTSLFSRIDSSL
jgi:Flp pilus assembly pilin Flp